MIQGRGQVYHRRTPPVLTEGSRLNTNAPCPGGLLKLLFRSPVSYAPARGFEVSHPPLKQPVAGDGSQTCPLGQALLPLKNITVGDRCQIWGLEAGISAPLSGVNPWEYRGIRGESGGQYCRGCPAEPFAGCEPPKKGIAPSLLRMGLLTACLPPSGYAIRRDLFYYLGTIRQVCWT